MEKLVQILAEMIDAHTRLLDLAKEKRTILVDGSIDGLQSVVIQENSCVNEIQKLDQQRQQSVQEYMAQKGIMGHFFSLEEYLKSKDDGALKSALTRMAEQIRHLIQEISYLNESNQQLILTSLSYIQFSVAMFVQKEPVIGYGPNAGNHYSNLLDAKV
ncbi:flagellar protein FlgN [Bacillus sp. 1NLA3E]|uniref:flagellar protein FlgN n=1 Tax=Bacillus sp. 1NLA3E TaxID=666686 RepID=UPI000247F32B|nr:flagellar protein FlgN [Bacillus sp. 1NLA3E]AGK55382.1 FlgN protein [Bacillus sp. 1NLA3E]